LLEQDFPVNGGSRNNKKNNKRKDNERKGKLIKRKEK
jgi:hypothetical protein